jgi:hypothetical protein
MRPLRPTSRLLLLAAVALLVAGALPQGAAGNHRWGNYHWARKNNPIRIQIIDSMSSAWDARLRAVNADWNASPVLENSVVGGSVSASTRRACPPVSGKIRACDANYGANGWLGLATIRVSGGRHIVDGTTKMNNHYFRQSGYNNEAARRHVLCQEIGHLFGLGHDRQSVTCMNDVAGISHPSYQYPTNNGSAHDFALLNAIYGHADGSTTVASRQASSPTWAPWVPDPIGRGKGGSSIFVRDLDNGQFVVTHVLWADEERNHDHEHEGEPQQAGAAEEPSEGGRRDRGQGGGAEDPADGGTGADGDEPGTTTPAAPTELAAEVRGSRVQLTWADNAGEEAAYVVYRSLDGGETWEPLAELEAGTTRYVDRAVEPGATYAYTVSAGNDAGESWSEPVKITVE